MNRYSAGHNLLQASAFAAPVLPMMILAAVYPHPLYVATLPDLGFLWLLGLGVSYGLIAVHETGHAIAARLVGLELTSITIGHWRKLFSFRLGSFTVTVRAAPSSGYVAAKLSPNSFSAPRVVVFLLAGVATELIPVGLAALGPDVPGIRSFGDLALVFGRITVLCIGTLQVLENLLPIEGIVAGDKHPTDGLQLLRLWKQRHQRPAQRQLFADGQKLDALRSAKRFTEAIEFATNLARQHPDNEGFLPLIASLHLEAGDTHTAEAIWRSLLAHPCESKTKRAEQLDQLSCLALYYDRVELLPEAEAWNNEALRYAPDAITLKGTRGSILIELGRIDEGIVLEREVIKRSECKIDQAVGSAYLAKAYAAKGDFTEARRWIDKACAIDSDHFVVKRIAGELMPKTVA